MQGELVTFQRFMHSVLVGVSGLERAMVRPAFQQNPPAVPDFKTDWLAYNLTNFEAENGQAFDNGALLERHESFECVCYFYGLNAVDRALVVRDSLELAQNRTALRVNNMGFKGASAVVRMPESVNGQYYERADMTLYFVRQWRRNYKILDFESAGGRLLANRVFTTFARVLDVRKES